MYWCFGAVPGIRGHSVYENPSGGEAECGRCVLRSYHGAEDGRLARQTEAALVVEGTDQP